MHVFLKGKWNNYKQILFVLQTQRGANEILGVYSLPKVKRFANVDNWLSFPMRRWYFSLPQPLNVEGQSFRLMFQTFNVRSGNRQLTIDSVIAAEPWRLMARVNN